MKKIKLTRGQFALVDDANYNWLNQWKWYASKEESGFYAVRNSSLKKGKRHQIRMHRLILGLEYGDSQQTDHQNHNTLDNRRDNIRIATSNQNGRNTKSHQDSTSQFKGVSWYKRLKKWQAAIYLNGKLKHLGFFTLERDAALAYNKVARKYFGEFAYLNFGGF